METYNHEESPFEELPTVTKTQLRMLTTPQLRKALNICLPEITKLRQVNRSNRRLIKNLKKNILELSENTLPTLQEWPTSGIREPVNILESCRFCFSEQMENLRIIDWTDVEFHDLPAIYEEVTASQLQISSDYSNLSCDTCINLLRRSSAVIRRFREVDEFWKKHLSDNSKSDGDGEMSTQYVAEMNVEFVNVDGDDAADARDEPVFFQYSEDTADVECIEALSVSDMADELTQDKEEIDADNLMIDVKEVAEPENSVPPRWTCTVCHKINGKKVDYFYWLMPKILNGQTGRLRLAIKKMTGVMGCVGHNPGSDPEYLDLYVVVKEFATPRA